MAKLHPRVLEEFLFNSVESWMAELLKTLTVWQGFGV